MILPPLSYDEIVGFWERVDTTSGPNACWPWTGTRHPKGYGRYNIRGLHLGAHRMALQLSGVQMADGQLACHSCDNPPCCNPAHLFAGNHRDNSLDAIAKGRLYTLRAANGNTCARGHDLSNARPDKYDGRVRCRRCRQDAQNAHGRPGRPRRFVGMPS